MQVEVACMHLTGRFFLRSSQADPCCDRRLGPEGARLCLEPLPASQGLGGDPTARERITTYLSPASRRPIARYSSVASIGQMQDHGAAPDLDSRSRVTSAETLCFEALIRWNHPQRFAYMSPVRPA